jgi:N-carbamoyl-L-amino-acid hydrolase
MADVRGDSNDNNPISQEPERPADGLSMRTARSVMHSAEQPGTQSAAQASAQSSEQTSAQITAYTSAHTHETSSAHTPETSSASADHGSLQLLSPSAVGSDESGTQRRRRLLRLLPRFWKRAELDAVDGCDAEVASEVVQLFAEVDGVGYHDGRGYTRLAWTYEDALMRVWFARECRLRKMRLSVDTAGNQWAWLGEPTPEHPGIAMGSHLDSVPHGGPFDGPLGVVSALCAIDALRRQGVIPEEGDPAVPIGIVNWSAEEGARFGAACFGSRVATGVIAPDDALARVDGKQTLKQAFRAYDDDLLQVLAGLYATNKKELYEASRAPDPAVYGRDDALLARLGCFMELHCDLGTFVKSEQVPVGIQGNIWPHGRWQVNIVGVANHAGTTMMNERHDPMPEFSRICLEVERIARDLGMLATIGRVNAIPNGINVIASSVSCFIDARAPYDATLDSFISRLKRVLDVRNEEGRCRLSLKQITRTPATVFDEGLEARMQDASERACGIRVPIFGMGAGHDAGILQDAGVPSGMLIVRNDTGQAHTPGEHVTLADCVEGVKALAASVAACVETMARA